LTGAPADVFNNIPFGTAVAAEIFSSGSFPGQNIPTTSAGVRQFIIDGEIATSLRTRSLFAASSLATLLGQGMNKYEAAALIANGLGLDNSVGSSQILSSYAGISASAQNLHSQSLMVLLLYANVNQDTDWTSIGPQLYAALFNDAIAKTVGFVKTTNAWDTPSAKMMAAIAYSALDSGYMPFGNTGIQSLFNDADTLGGIQTAGELTGLLSTYPSYYSDQVSAAVTPVGALTEIAVQFAADQAAAAQQAGTGLGNTNQSLAQGAFELDGSTLKVDLDPTEWTSTFPQGNQPVSPTTAVLGLGDFFNAVLSNISAQMNSSDPTYSWIAGTEAGFGAPLLKQLNEITEVDISLSAGNLSAAGTLPAAYDGTPGGALLIGGNGQGTIVGSSKGNDIIVGGQTITAGDGNNIILASGGPESITVGKGNNLILADSAGMNVALTYAGALGAPNTGSGAAGASGEGPAPTSTHQGDDLVIGNGAGGDTFTFNGADQAAFTVVWGGSGNDTFDFNTTNSSANANVLLLTMNGVTASNITSLDVSKLQSYVDKTYASTGDAPTIVILNATASDAIDLNNVKLSSPGVTTTTYTAHWAPSPTTGWGFNYGPADNAYNDYGVLNLTWYDGLRLDDNEYSVDTGFTNVNNQLSANGLDYNYTGTQSSGYGGPAVAPILGVTAATGGGLNLVNFAPNEFGVSLDAGIGASAGTSNFFGATYAVSNWGTIVEDWFARGIYDGADPQGLEQISTFSTPLQSLGYLINPNALNGPSAPALNINDYLLPSGSGNGNGNGNGGNNGGGGDNGGGDNSGGNTETGGGGLPIVSATAFVQDQANLDSQHQAFLVYDTAQNVSAVFDALNDDSNVVSITLTDSGTPALQLTASQAINDTTALNAITNTDFTIAINDTAANVSANLDALNLDSDVASITLTDSGTPALQLSASQAANDTVALSEITNSAYAIDINDTAANVSADFDALNANTNVASITLTDGDDPTLSLSVTQALGDTNALDEITNPDFSIAIVDAASSVSASFDALAADAGIFSISLTDGGAPTLDLSVSQALDDTSTLAKITNADYAIQIVDTVSDVLDATAALDADTLISGITIVDSVANITVNATVLAANSKIKSITVEDTAADITANAAALAANSEIGSIVVVDTVANVLADAGSLAGDTIHVSDTAANVSSNIDALNADTGISAIDLTGSGTPTLTLTVGQALGDAIALGEIKNASYVVDISDTAANVAAHLDALASDAFLGAITLTDGGTPTLTVSAEQLVNDATVLADISNPNVAIDVSDTAASVSANIAALENDSKVASIDLTGSGTPTLSLDVEQALGDTTALGKIANPIYSISLSDTAADVSLTIDALNADDKISSITLTDSGTPALMLSAAQALDDTTALGEIANTGYQIEVFDTAANILSDNAAFAANSHVASAVVVDTAAAVLAQAAAIAADTRVSSVMVSDTAADVSADIDALNADSELRVVAFTDSGVPTLRLSVAQALDDGYAISKIVNKNFKIAISDTAANVSANIDVLNAEGAIGSISLTDSGTPTLDLSVGQAVADSQVLSKITNKNYAIAISDDAANVVKDAAGLTAASNIMSVAVTDSAADISADFDALGAIASLSSITLTDSGVPRLTLSVSQTLDGSAELGKIAGAYGIVVSDDVANVLADEAGLSADSNVNWVEVTDTAANVLNNSAALVADGKVLSVTVSDTASDVLADESGLAADAGIRSVEVVDNVANILANSAALHADSNLRSIEVVDTAANIAANIAALSQVNSGTRIEITISGTPMLTLSVAEALDTRDILGAFTVDVVDTAANIAANIDQLDAMSSIGSITATNSSVATLTLTASQALYDGTVLGLIGSANSRIVVNDTAANISANIDALNADSAVASITLSDTGTPTPTLALTVAQALNDTSALGKIANTEYGVVVSDTAANVLANATALQADSRIASIAVVDTAANVLSNQGALAAEPQVTAVTVTDTAANVVANSAALSRDNLVAAIDISDSAANISANIDAMNGLAGLSSITITNYSALTLTAAQALNDTNVFNAIQNGGGSFSVDVSDTAANIVSNLSALTADEHVRSIGIVDTAAHVVNNLSALEAASYSGSITVEDTSANILANMTIFSGSSLTIQFANTSPAVTITSVAEGSNVATQVIAGTVFPWGSANVVGQTLTLTDNGTTLGTTTVQSDGTFTTTITLPNEGANLIVASVTDGNGVTGISGAVVDTLDDVAPTVTITSLPESGNIAAQTIVGTVVSGGAALVVGQTVTLTDNGTTLATGTVQADDTFTVSVTLANQGANAIAATVSDSYGNTGVSAAVVDTLNQNAATVTITSAAEASNSSNQTIAGTVAANGTASVIGQIVTLTDNGTTLATATVQADGTFTSNLTLSNEGRNSIVATVTDSEGNTGSSTPVVDTLDNIPSTVTLTSPTESSDAAAQTITGTVVSGGTATVVGQTVTLTDNGTTLGTTTVQSNGTFSALVTLPNQGTNSIVATATDSYGNTGSSAAVVDTLETIAPTVTITSVAEASSVANQSITGTVASGDAAAVVGQTVTLTDNGTALGTATVQSNGTFSASVTLPNQGSNSIVASVTDSFGQTGSSAAVVDTLNEVSGYHFTSGQGRVTIDPSVGTVVMGPGITASDVDLQSNAFGDLTISVSGDSTDSVVVNSDLTDINGTVTSALSAIQFSDGTTLNLEQNPLTFTWRGNTSNFNLTGSDFGPNLFDIRAANGSITLGNASKGGSGQNTIEYGKGDGHLNVDLNGGTGTLVLGAGITTSDVDVQSDGFGNLTVSFNGDTTDSVVANSDLTDINGTVTSALSAIQFSDGTTLNLEQNPLTFTWLGNAGNFNLTGSNFGPNLFDVTASNGSITLGNASKGGNGQNTIEYSKGDGHLSVALNGGTGTLELGEGIAASDLDVQSDNFGNLTVSFNGDSTDSIVANGDLTDNNGTVTSALSAIQFSDGTVVDTVDSFAPKVSITSEAEASNVAAQTISGTVTSGGASVLTGQTVTLIDNGTTLGTATIQADGSFAASVMLPNQGSNSIVAAVTDSYGFTGSSAAVVDMLDNVAPTVTITSPAESGGIAAQAITGTVTSGGAAAVVGQIVTLTDNGTTLGTATVQSNGIFTASVTLPYQGANSIQATVSDTYGNTGGSAAVVDTLNDNAPTVTIISSAEASNDANQTVSGTVVSVGTASVVGQTLTLTDNGTTLGTTTVQANGSFSASVTLLNLGSNSIVATVTDNDGNTGTSSAVVDTLESIAPTVTISSEVLADDTGASSTDYITMDGQATLTGTTSAGSTVAIFDGASDVGSATVSGTNWAFSTDLGEGTHQLYAVATGSDGTTSTSAPAQTIVVDDTAPQIVISGLSDVVEGQDVALVLTGTSSADSNVQIFQGTTLLGAVTANTAGAWSFDAGLLSPGVYEFLATATDLAGNVGTSSIVPDTVDPLIAVLPVSGGGGSSGGFSGGGGGQVGVPVGTPIVYLGASNPASLYMQANGYGDLILQVYGDTADRIVIPGDLTDRAGTVVSTVIQLVFDGGTTINLNQGTPLTFTWLGNANNYNLTGSNFGSNVFDVSAGNGSITFGNSSQGGSGTNSIEFDKGDGSANVNLNGGTGAIVFGSDVAPQDVYWEADGYGNLIVKILGDAADSITIDDDLTDSNGTVTSGLDQLQFSDGTVVNLGQGSSQGGPLTFTWLGNTNYFNLTGANYGANLFDITAGANNGSITFGNSSKGGDGENTVEYTLGDNNVSVNLNGGTGAIAFGAGITAQDVYWQADGYGNLTVRILADTTDSITIDNDLTNNAGTVTSGLDQLQFSDGTVVNLGQGSSQGGPLTFTWLGNTNYFNLTGANYGSNLFDITAGANNGSITFGNSSKGGDGENTIDFALGDNNVSVNLNGGTGAIAFGAGITAQDVYWQADGYGNLTVRILGDTTDSITIDNDLTDSSGIVTSGLNQLQFSDGTVVNLGQGSSQGGPLTFTWLGNSNYYNLTGANYGSNLFDITAGANNGSITFGNSSRGGSGTNTIQYVEGDGNVTVNLNGGSGAIAFGTGVTAQDVYWQADGYGNLTVRILGDATDSITVDNDLINNAGTVTSGLDQLQFSDGTVVNLGQGSSQGGPLTFTWLGNSNYYNLTGANYGSNLFDITAGANNGSITFGNSSRGGSGNNTIQYVEGDGNVTVNLNGGSGAIAFGTGVTAQDVYWQADGYGNLTVRILGDTTDGITIDNDLTDSSGTVTSGLDQLQFSDGTVVNLGQGSSQGGPLTFTWLGNTSNYNLTGSNYGSNVFDITAGNGSITFGNSSRGGPGTNTIEYGEGDGRLDAYLNGGAGALQMGSGLTASNVYLQSNGYGDLMVGILGDATDSVTIHNDLSDSNGTVTSGLSQIQFGDGSVLNLGQGSPITFTWLGASNASLYGSNYGANIFELGAGSESAIGGNTNNGGSGNNMYIASSSTGQATIYANEVAGSTNELDFVGGITSTDLWFQQSGNDLKIDLLGTSTQVDVNGWFSNSANQLQEISAGGLKIDSQISQLVQAMATYSANNPGFDPTASGVSKIPNDSNLQTTLAAAWHA
jgi:hypothetical protein